MFFTFPTLYLSFIYRYIYHGISDSVIMIFCHHTYFIHPRHLKIQFIFQHCSIG